MKKFLIKLWSQGRNPEASKQAGGSYVTIKFTPPTEEGETENRIQFWNDGECFIPCDDYEILGGQSDDNWVDYFKFSFDGICLVISTAEKSQEKFNISFPVPVKS